MQVETFTNNPNAKNIPYNVGMKKISVTREGVGARLTELRLKVNLSQKELAELVNVPIANIGFWERTNTPPSSKILPRLAEVLGASVEEVLTGNARQTRRNSGRSGRLKETFDDVSKLPRNRQKKILDVVDALLVQAAH